MRKEYEMTQAQLDKILEACKPVPYILGSGGIGPRSQQKNANDAWMALGQEMGFDHMSVRPNGKGDRFFTADEAGTPEPPEPDGECFRGGEAAAYEAEQMAQWQRLK